MKVHITNLNGLNSAAAIAQNKSAQIGMELGFHEIGLYNYDSLTDSPSELSKRLDGIISMLSIGDVVIFQHPSWNDYSFDRALINKFKIYKAKLIIWVQDVIGLMFNSHKKEDIQAVIDIYNMADLLILPSTRMRVFLQEHGLNTSNILIQQLWDYPMDAFDPAPVFQRKIVFSGLPSRFEFVNKWNLDTPLVFYSKEKPDISNEKIEYRGYFRGNDFIYRISEGGFGLVWGNRNDFDYYTMNQPYKAATFLAAGIPLIIQEGLVPEKMVRKNNLGMVVSSFEEADHVVKTISEEDYYSMVKSAQNAGWLIRRGYFTRKLLMDSVANVMGDYTYIQ